MSRQQRRASHAPAFPSTRFSSLHGDAVAARMLSRVRRAVPLLRCCERVADAAAAAVERLTATLRRLPSRRVLSRRLPACVATSAKCSPHARFDAEECSGACAMRRAQRSAEGRDCSDARLRSVAASSAATLVDPTLSDALSSAPFTTMGL